MTLSVATLAVERSAEFGVAVEVEVDDVEEVVEVIGDLVTGGAFAVKVDEGEVSVIGVDPRGRPFKVVVRRR